MWVCKLPSLFIESVTCCICIDVISVRLCVIVLKIKGLQRDGIIGQRCIDQDAASADCNSYRMSDAGNEASIITGRAMTSSDGTETSSFWQREMNKGG
jgi:hypothetical protein